MPTFRYRAYGLDGGLAEGAIDAASVDAASEILWSQGLTPFQMRASAEGGTKWWNREITIGGGSEPADLVAFTREFAMLSAAEIALDDALRILQTQASSSRLRALVEGLLSEVLNGAPLSDAMQKQAKVFPADYIAVVRAAETGGTLSEVLTELAELLERRAEIRSRVQSALIYPTMLVTLSLGALAIIIGGLIPSIAPVFGQSGKPMPGTIKFMLGLRDHWAQIVGGMAVVAMGSWASVAVAMRRNDARVELDRLKLKFPVIGAFLLQQEAARFARTLGTMLKAGVPLIQATKSASSVISNCYIASSLGRAIEAVHQGSALHRALRNEAVLPAIALQMISVGEEAGKLDRMLMRVAIMLERQTQSSIDRFMAALAPALTVGIAVMVGALIMPVMNAVLSINDLAGR
ncbi:MULTISPECIES: type II secretion system F family protein [unclassified Bradyrhizobium]|uniref:type II secretion system F family protein n=1 Tax=unclassified Bradyrhizobium TaxID=2631580 RepID=UPI001BA4695F|nr:MULTISPECIES: type II secretion system F family protein [unclassified Bradyrhizobium]MBR1201852.1 type II secretion system F family protein [Bradyrhizobium sp. AUGA SZCCT0124]MBR1311579.1 type II secretion system F family protein [Bradyrhizobium sp. AUGA SZCCT0051]MBR1338801.1 type II secretion system F family protein [Bradyrhizobium sp. AUGA SZCCT0105]MBR1353375.1 type II secretion system F family protein [Bradyrhizobium sp. AUGA SZCCT0045]